MLENAGVHLIVQACTANNVFSNGSIKPILTSPSRTVNRVWPSIDWYLTCHQLSAAVFVLCLWPPIDLLLAAVFHMDKWQSSTKLAVDFDPLTLWRLVIMMIALSWLPWTVAVGRLLWYLNYFDILSWSIRQCVHNLRRQTDARQHCRLPRSITWHAKIRWSPSTHCLKFESPRSHRPPPRMYTASTSIFSRHIFIKSVYILCFTDLFAMTDSGRSVVRYVSGHILTTK